MLNLPFSAVGDDTAIPDPYTPPDGTWNISGGLAITGNLSAVGVTSTDLTAGRVVFAGTGGLLDDDAGLTYVAGAAATLTYNTIGTAQTAGVSITNATAAAAGAQQYSPGLTLTGQGWKTNTTAASQPVDWMLQCRPVQGAAAPSSAIDFLSQINGGGWTNAFSIDADGDVLCGPSLTLGERSGSVGKLYFFNSNVGIERSGASGLEFSTGSDANCWTMTSAGHLLAGIDATFDIGASGANRPRNIYVSGSVVAGSLTLDGTNSQLSYQTGTSLVLGASGLVSLASIGSATIYIDSDNDTANATFRISKDSREAGGTEVVLLTLTEAGALSLAQPVSTSGSPVGITYTGGAHTTLAASAEASDINFNLARSVQFATGALTTQRAIQIGQPTYGFVAASTLTTAITADIAGAPTQGTNATITNAIGLRVGGAITQASAASATYAAISVPVHTVTLAGTTQVTSTAYAAGVSIGQITITDASAVTVNAAASLYIAAAPLQAGSVTISDTYAILAAPDTDTKFVFGRGAISSNTTDTVEFHHYDQRNSGVNYGLRISASGTTILNSAATGTYLAYGGTFRWLVDSDGHFTTFVDNTYDLGQNDLGIRSGYFGTSVIMGTGDAGTPGAATIRGANAAGTNIAGAVTTIAAGKGTGTGNIGTLVFSAAPAKAGTGTDAHTSATYLTIGHSQAAHPGTTGCLIDAASQTFNDYNTGASGTAASLGAYAFQPPVFKATNTSVTTTDASTMYIGGAPTVSTNMTFTAAHALYVGMANVSSNSQYRALTTAAWTQTITAGVAAAYAVAFNAPIFSAATQQTITTAATVYISGAPTGTGAGPALFTNSYALLVAAGTVRLDGNLDLTEKTAPTGLANTARIYAEDNGSGKTRLMAIFGSGAAQQIAIEP